MIDKLADLLENFPGDPNRARCFNHVIALVAQKMTRQFDVPKGGVDAALDEAEKELRNLAEGIDIEEMLTKSRSTLHSPTGFHRVHKDSVESTKNLHGLNGDSTRTPWKPVEAFPTISQ